MIRLIIFLDALLLDVFQYLADIKVSRKRILMNDNIGWLIWCMFEYRSISSLNTFFLEQHVDHRSLVFFNSFIKPRSTFICMYIIFIVFVSLLFENTLE